MSSIHINDRNTFLSSSTTLALSASAQIVTEQTSKIPLLDSTGKLNNILASVPNPIPGKRTYDRVVQKLRQEIRLGKYTLPFHHLLFYINHSKLIPAHSILLIGSGAIHAYDPEERDQHFIDAGAGALLTPRFKAKLATTPRDTDWRLTLDAKIANWEDVEAYVILILHFLAKNAKINPNRFKTKEALAESLGIYLDKSQDQYYIFRFLESGLDVAVGFFKVHSLFDDTNVQIAVAPKSISHCLSKLELSIQTEQGINLLQAFTYRGKGVIAAMNPSEKDYRAIIHLIHRMMQGEECYSAGDICIYLKTFLEKFKHNWPYHLAKKIHNIFKGHHQDSLRGMAWALLQFEVIAQHFCPPELKSLIHTHKNIWQELMLTIDKNLLNKFLEDPLVKARYYYGINAYAVQAVIGITALGTSVCPEDPPSRSSFGIDFTSCRVPFSEGQGEHRVIVPGIWANQLTTIVHFFDSVSHSPDHAGILFNLFTLCFDRGNLTNRSLAIPGILTISDHHWDRWAFSANSLMKVIHAIVAYAKSRAGCKLSERALLTYIIPSLLCTESHFAAIQFGRTLSSYILEIAPLRKHSIMPLLARENLTHPAWLQILAATHERSCCSIAANQWIASGYIEDKNIADLIAFLNELCRGSPVQALSILRAILDHEIQLSTANLIALYHQFLNSIGPKLDAPDVMAKIEPLIELTSRMFEDSYVHSDALSTLIFALKQHRKDLLSIWIHWVPYLEFDQDNVEGISLAYQLAHSATSNEQRKILAEYVLKNIALPGCMDFLLSRIFFKTYRGTGYLKRLWEAMLIKGAAAHARKLCLAQRWLKITIKDAASAEKPPVFDISKLILDILEKYSASQQPTPPISTLQKILFTLWEHPFFQTENSKKQIVLSFIKLLEIALKQPGYPLAPLAYFVVDKKFLNYFYQTESSAASLFPLLRALIYGDEECLSAALALAEELKSDQTTHLSTWQNTLTRLSLLCHHQQTSDSLHKLAQIASVNTALAQTGLQYTIDAMGMEAKTNRAKAAISLKGLICQSDRLSSSQKQQVAIIAHHMLETHAETAPPQWLIDDSFKAGMGEIEWLKCVDIYFKQSFDVALLSLLVKFITHSEKKLEETASKTLASVCLKNLHLVQPALCATNRWLLLSKLEPYISDEDAPGLQEKLICVMHELKDENSLHALTKALVKISKDRKVPEKLEPLVIECALNINANTSIDILEIFVCHFFDYFTPGAWKKVWNALHEIKNARLCDMAFCSLQQCHPMHLSSPIPLKAIYRQALIALCSVNSNKVNAFANSIALFQDIFPLASADPDIQERVCLSLAEHLKGQEDAAVLKLWFETLSEYVTDPEKKSLLLSRFIKKSLTNSHRQLLKELLLQFLQCCCKSTERPEIKAEFHSLSLLKELWSIRDTSIILDLLGLSALLALQLSDHWMHLENMSRILNWSFSYHEEDPQIKEKQISLTMNNLWILLKHENTKCDQVLSSLIRKHQNKFVCTFKQFWISNLNHAENILLKLQKKNLLPKDLLSSLCGEFTFYSLTITHTSVQKLPELISGFRLFFNFYETLKQNSKWEQSCTTIAFKCISKLLSLQDGYACFPFVLHDLVNLPILAPPTKIKFKLNLTKSNVNYSEELKGWVSTAKLTQYTGNEKYIENRIQLFKILLGVSSDYLECRIMIEKLLIIFTFVLSHDLIVKGIKKDVQAAIIDLIEAFLYSQKFDVLNLDSSKRILDIMQSCDSLISNKHRLFRLELYLLPQPRTVVQNPQAELYILLTHLKKSPDQLLAFYEKSSKLLHAMRHFNDHPYEKIGFYGFLLSIASTLESTFDIILAHQCAIAQLFLKEDISMVAGNEDFCEKMILLGVYYFKSQLNLLERATNLYPKSITDLLTCTENLMDTFLVGGVFSNRWEDYENCALMVLKISLQFTNARNHFEALLYLPEKYCIIDGRMRGYFPEIDDGKRFALAGIFITQIQPRLQSRSYLKYLLNKHNNFFTQFEKISKFISLISNASETSALIYTDPDDSSHTNLLHALNLLHLTQIRKLKLYNPHTFLTRTLQHIENLVQNHEIQKAEEVMAEFLTISLPSETVAKAQEVLRSLFKHGLSCPAARRETFKKAVQAGLMEGITAQDELYLMTCTELHQMMKEPSPSQNLEGVLVHYLHSLCEEKDFNSTIWVWPLIPLISPLEQDNFWLIGFHRFFEDNNYDDALDFACRLSADFKLQPETADHLFMILENVLADDTPPSDNSSKLIQLLKAPIASKLSAFPHTFSHSFAKIIQSISFNKIQSHPEVFEFLLDEFLHSITNICADQLRERQILFYNKLNIRLSYLLLGTFSLDPQRAVHWARSYYRCWVSINIPSVGAALVFKYLRQLHEIKREIPLHAIDFEELFVAGECLALDCQTHHFYDLQYLSCLPIPGEISPIKNVLISKSRIINNLLARKPGWAKANLTALLDFLAECLGVNPSMEIPHKALHELASTLQHQKMYYLAYKLYAILKYHHCDKETVIQEKSTILFYDALQNGIYDDLLQILFRDESVQKEMGAEKLTPLFILILSTKAVKWKNVEIILKLVLKLRINSINILNIFILNYKDNSFSLETHLRLFFILKQLPYATSQGDNEFISNTWLWFLEKLFHDKIHLNLSYLHDFNVLNQIQEYLKDEKKLQFRQWVLVHSLRNLSVSSASCQFLLALRSKVFVTSKTVDGGILEDIDCKLIEKIMQTKDLQLFHSLCLQSRIFSLKPFYLIESSLLQILREQIHLVSSGQKFIQYIPEIFSAILPFATFEFIIESSTLLIGSKEQVFLKQGLSMILNAYECILKTQDKTILAVQIKNMTFLINEAVANGMQQDQIFLSKMLIQLLKQRDLPRLFKEDISFVQNMWVKALNFEYAAALNNDNPEIELKKAFNNVRAYLPYIHDLKTLYCPLLSSMLENFITFQLLHNEPKAYKAMFNEIMQTVNAFNSGIKDKSYLDNKMSYPYFYSYPRLAVFGVLFEAIRSYNEKKFSDAACIRVLKDVLISFEELLKEAKKNKVYHEYCGTLISLIVRSNLGLRSDAVYLWFMNEISILMNNWVKGQQIKIAARELLTIQLFIDEGLKDVNGLKPLEKMMVISQITKGILTYPTWRRIKKAIDILNNYCNLPTVKSEVFPQDSKQSHKLIHFLLDALPRMKAGDHYEMNSFIDFAHFLYKLAPGNALEAEEVILRIKGAFFQYLERNSDARSQQDFYYSDASEALIFIITHPLTISYLNNNQKEWIRFTKLWWMLQKEYFTIALSGDQNQQTTEIFIEKLDIKIHQYTSVIKTWMNLSYDIKTETLLILQSHLISIIHLFPSDQTQNRMEALYKQQDLMEFNP